MDQQGADRVLPPGDETESDAPDTTEDTPIIVEPPEVQPHKPARAKIVEMIANMPWDEMTGRFVLGEYVVDPETKTKVIVPREPREDDYATFIIMGPAGVKHVVIINPTEYRLQSTGSGVPRNMPRAGSSVKGKFDDGACTTCDPNIWIGMMQASKGFGTEYTANPDDPTGFWERAGLLKKEQVEVTRVSQEVDPSAASKLVAGARNSRDRPIPAMRG